MSSNLPPGVNENDIPGNRPEDVAWEEFLDWVSDELGKFDLEDAHRAVKIGMAAVHAESDDIHRMTERAYEAGWFDAQDPGVS